MTKDMTESEIQEKIRSLPDDLRVEVMDFIDLLLERKQKQDTATVEFRFDWEGGLSDIRDRFSSVGLQHRASELR